MVAGRPQPALDFTVSEFDHCNYRLRPVARAQLAADAADMQFDSSDLNIKRMGNVFVGPPQHKMTQNFFLARRQVQGRLQTFFHDVAT